MRSAHTECAKYDSIASGSGLLLMARYEPAHVALSVVRDRLRGGRSSVGDAGGLCGRSACIRRQRRRSSRCRRRPDGDQSVRDFVDAIQRRL